jgi:acetylornithine deacetylase
MRDLALQYDDDLQAFVERLLRFKTTSGNEQQAQEWVESELAALGYDVYTWDAPAEELAEFDEFPSASEIDTAERPSVGGVLEFGDPDAGPTLVLNGHIDVVPVEESSWDSNPFEPTWTDTALSARGAVDMKAGLGACVFAALVLHKEYGDGLNGRIVVESVAGEEDGGIGTATAAHLNPYPFERDAVVVAEPTEMGVVTATEGNLMKEIQLTGRSAHAATRWRGESVLPHFERIRRAFEELEAERDETTTHPLYKDYPLSWPVNVGIVRAGSWASSVPAHLSAHVRIGVAPGESLEAAETAFQNRLDEVTSNSEWLTAHPPTFERRSIQFASAECDPDAEIVGTLQAAMDEHGLKATEPYGATYGADSRHYLAAGIPTVLFGPGSVDHAHFPNESVDWSEVQTATAVLAETGRRFLA